MIASNNTYNSGMQHYEHSFRPMNAETHNTHTTHDHNDHGGNHLSYCSCCNEIEEKYNEYKEKLGIRSYDSHRSNSSASFN
jgi:hypothetical protein